jgi:hypothetical protein
MNITQTGRMVDVTGIVSNIGECHTLLGQGL